MNEDCGGLSGIGVQAALEPRGNDVPQAAPTVANPWHDVIVKRVSNGFIVKVGCKTLVARKWDTVAEGLAMYWKDPCAAEKEYCDAN
jgi:hypothetical protein